MTKMMTAAIAALVMTGGAAQAQNLLTNGGFEGPVVTNACCTTTPPDSFPGWTVTAGDINVVNGTFASNPGGTNLAFEGNQYLDLIGQAPTGAIEQAFGTVAGRTYNLSFRYSHNLFGGLQSASANYAVGNLAGSVTHSTGTNSDLDWQLFSGSFVAGGASSTLSFANLLGGPNAGLLLDDVSVTAVPEPAAWAMMIGGFGLVGGTMRRRRARTTVAFA